MLSSVANRFYWCGRYLERAENTARLLNVYTQLLLDLPDEAGMTMRHLVRIFGSESLFEKNRGWPEEASVVRFLASEPTNPGSILTSISSARENLRTLRDIVPLEGFEAVNELHLDASRMLLRVAIRRLRFGALQTIVERCQQINGLFAANMAHGDAYNFLRIGRNLERADMTTRIVDVAGDLLTADSDTADLTEYQTILWVNVLRSLSAYQAYRQSVKSRIVPMRVLHFIMTDRNFPRTVSHCLREIDNACQQLPKPDPVRAAIHEMESVMRGVGVRELASSALHDHMDRFQLELAAIHAAIENNWFKHDRQKERTSA